MKRILLALALLLAVAGCNEPTLKKVDVDGTTCVEATSKRGVAIDCDWSAR